MIDDQLFKQGMRRLASGVSLVTTRNEGIAYGMACTSVTSVSADPPSILVCVNKNASSHAHIEKAGIFCANLLSSDNLDLANVFSSSASRDARFGAGDWGELRTGAPVLRTAEAIFDCRVIEKLQVHTHTIFVGAVVAAQIGGELLAPLVYHNGRYSTLAAVG